MNLSEFTDKGQNWIKHNIFQTIFKKSYLKRFSKTFYKNYKSYFERSPIINNEKIKVGFFIQRQETFDSVKSVVEKMILDNNFEIYLIVLPRFNQNTFEFMFETISTNMEFANKYKGKCQVINSYKDDKFIDLASLKLNYLFLATPYEEHYPKEYSFDKLHAFTRVCLIQYAYLCWNKLAYIEATFPEKTIACSDYIFADNPTSLNYLNAVFTTVRKNTGHNYIYNLGFPPLDALNEVTANSYRSLMWIPRWTTSSKDHVGSSFLKFKDNITELINENSFKVIVRPHPLMFDNYIDKGILSKQEIESFKKKCFVNGSVISEGGEYLDAIEKADILLSDYSSLTIYYALLNKPIIYLESKRTFARDIRYLCKSFYFAKNWQDVERILNNLKQGIDPKKDARRKVIDKFNSQHPKNSGEKIVSFLKEEYYKEMKKWY